MEFFKKRSTAWAVFRLSVIIAFFIGRRKVHSSEPEVLPGGQYVQDKADVLTDADEEYINNYNNGLSSLLGAEIQVAAIDTTSGQDINTMAVNLGVDENLSGNSCVMLVAVEDGTAAIVAGEEIMYWPSFGDRELSDILYRSFSGTKLSENLSGTELVSVTDNEDIIPRQTEEYINGINDALRALTGGEIYIFTTDSSAGELRADATDFAEDIGLTGNSCMIAISPDEGAVEIIPGYDLGSYSDYSRENLRVIADTGLDRDTFRGSDEDIAEGIRRIFDSLTQMYERVFSLNINSYSPDRTPEKSVGEGIVTAFDRLITGYENDYGVSIQPMNYLPAPVETGSNSLSGVVVSCLIILVVVVLLVALLSPTRRARRYVGRVSPLGRPFYPPPPPPPRTGNYPPRGSYPSHSAPGPGSRRGGFSRGSSRTYSGDTRTGGFTSSDPAPPPRGNSGGSSGSPGHPPVSSDSRGGGFGSSSRGGSYGGSRTGGFTKK